MPFISAAAIRYLWSQHRGYDVCLPRSSDGRQPLGYDVCLPRSSDGRQPLHAIYKKSCLVAIKKQLEAGQLKN